MKKIYLLIILLFPILLNAQDKLTYKLNGKTIEFSISKDSYLLKFDESKSANIKNKSADNYIPVTKNYALVKLKIDDEEKSFAERILIVKEKFGNDQLKVEPVLIYKDGIEQICKGELIIRVTDKNMINTLFEGFSFTSEINKLIENQFLIVIENIDTKDLFQLAERLEQNSTVIFVTPNFTRFLKPHTNDPLLNSQWSINNQGYLGGTIDSDMDIDDAWAISTGTNIKVAIIDEGVDLTHTDLSPNLLAGYDATDINLNGAPNTSNDDGHGTSCAGIVSAVGNNGIGVVGVAYNAKIIPVRIGYSNGLALTDPNRAWITNDNWIANGITWAYQNGADILSNSWGGGSPSPAITNAINNAVNNGRSGKGATVLFSSGNSNTNVSYPANLPNAIAVGATSMCDQRKTPTSCDGETLWGSNFGTEIDIVAPGVKIYTTDISGSDGYASGDVVANFNGTSSACPNAAGVAALILSVNPNLTQNEVREILETSTDKISGYSYTSSSSNINGTWNNQVGYGRVNAFKAVQMALPPLFDDVDQVCYDVNTLINLNNSQNYPVTWQVSSNVTKISSNNQSITIRSKYATSPGSGWVKATVNGIEHTEAFGVNKGENEINMSVTVSLVNNYLTITIHDGSGNTPYDLYFNNAYKLSTSSRTITFPYYQNSGRVEIRNQNSCGTGINYAFYTGYFGGSYNYSYNVFPNPTSESLTIEKKESTLKDVSNSNFDIDKNSQFELYDFYQNLVSKGDISNLTNLNVSNFKEGLYILLIITNGNYESHQIIIK